MPTITSLTPAEIDGLNYDVAKKEVYACGFKGTWIANATVATLRSLLKGEVTPIDAATITLNAMATKSGGTPAPIITAPPAAPLTAPAPPAPAPAAPVSLDGMFGAAIGAAVDSHLKGIHARLDEISEAVGSTPPDIEDRLQKVQDTVLSQCSVIDSSLETLKTKIADALSTGGAAAARVIAPILGVSASGTFDPIRRALEYYCAPGNALKPVLVKGGPGSGKTYAAREHGKSFDRYVEIGVYPETQSSDLIGYMTPVEPWVDGPLTDAFRAAAAGQRVLLVIDELYRASGPARQCLLTPLAPAEIDGASYYRLRTGKPVVDSVTGATTSEVLLAPQENLAIVATTNVGGKFDVSPADPAEKERFVPVHVEVQESKLRGILESWAAAKGFPNATADAAIKFWKACKVLVADNFLEQCPSTRLLAEALKYSRDEADVPNRILDMGLHIWVAETLDGLPEPEQCKRVVDALKGAFPGFKPEPTGDPAIDAVILV
jgi:hypothetical protein